MLLVDQVDAMRDACAATMHDRPVRCDAMAVMPDHLHAVRTLPEGDDAFTERWRLIKTRFSRAVAVEAPQHASHVAKRERGIWRRRFWERCICDEDEWRAAIRYVWTNPVKHGFVARPEDWPYSSAVGFRP
jgi:putative transposase